MMAKDLIIPLFTISGGLLRGAHKHSNTDNQDYISKQSLSRTRNRTCAYANPVKIMILYIRQQQAHVSKKKKHAVIQASRRCATPVDVHYT